MAMHLMVVVGAFTTKDLKTLENIFLLEVVVFGLMYLLHGGSMNPFSILE